MSFWNTLESLSGRFLASYWTASGHKLNMHWRVCSTLLQMLQLLFLVFIILSVWNLMVDDKDFKNTFAYWNIFSMKCDLFQPQTLKNYQVVWLKLKRETNWEQFLFPDLVSFVIVSLSPLSSTTSEWIRGQLCRCQHIYMLDWMLNSQCRLSGDKLCLNSFQSIHDPTGLSTKDKRRVSNGGPKPVLTLVAKPSVLSLDLLLFLREAIKVTRSPNAVLLQFKHV